MRWIRDLPVRAKVGLVVGAMALALAGEIALSLSAIERLRVGGPAYRGIREYRDAIETITSLESDLNAYQAALFALPSHLERDALRQGNARRAEIEARVDGAFQAVSSLALAEEIRVGLESAHRTWTEFRDTCRARVVPAIERGDPGGIRDLTSGPQARRSQRFIEQVATAVNQARLEVEALEVAAARDARRSVWTMAAAVAAIVAAALAVVFVVVRSITRPLRSLTASANRIAGGTIPAQRIALGTSDELGRLADVFDEMLGTVRTIVAGAQRAAARLDESSRELLAANRQMSEGAKEQATQLQAVSNETAHMAAALHELSSTADAVSRTASNNAAAAEDGALAVSETTAGLDAIRTATDEVRRALVSVMEASVRIRAIVQTLQDIADETHVLSINASIEAARAGESGHGFAVVASEVRSLAKRAADSSKEITQTAAGIFENMRAAESAVGRNITAVAKGAESSLVLGRSFEAIHESAKATHASVHEMTGVLREQVGATQRTVNVVGAVSRVSEESLAATEQIVELGSRLQEVMHDLENLLGRFAVEEDAPPGPGSPG